MENVCHIDNEDFGDLISQMEISLGFKFNDEEITNNMSIDEFSERVISKLDMENGQECTTQIAFYRIRKALIEKLKIEKSIVNPKLELGIVFPKKNRIQNWKIVFGVLKYDGIDLQPHLIPHGLSILTTIISFFLIFGSYRLYAIPICITSIILTKLLSRYGKSFPAKNIGELTKRIVQYNYKNVRSEKGTINIVEIKKLVFHQLTDWFQPNKIKNMNMETKINYID